MAFNAGDLVRVKPEGVGVIKASSIGEEGPNYLIEFEDGVKDWYPENLIELLQREGKPTTAPRRTGWFQNPELKESILDAWYKLSPETFNQAFEVFEGFGSQMIEWLKEINPELYKNAYIEGHKLMGVTIHYVSPKENPNGVSQG